MVVGNQPRKKVDIEKLQQDIVNIPDNNRVLKILAIIDDIMVKAFKNIVLHQILIINQRIEIRYKIEAGTCFVLMDVFYVHNADGKYTITNAMINF